MNNDTANSQQYANPTDLPPGADLEPISIRDASPLTDDDLAELQQFLAEQETRAIEAKTAQRHQLAEMAAPFKREIESKMVEVAEAVDEIKRLFVLAAGNGNEEALRGLIQHLGLDMKPQDIDDGEAFEPYTEAHLVRETIKQTAPHKAHAVLRRHVNALGHMADRIDDSDAATNAFAEELQRLGQITRHLNSMSDDIPF